ncbi:ankyrin repeat domain-containing protein [Erysipelothrix sp. HDW6C]|uniref:ankyrin repeat domain-containing protein n=1 Tax=Erysipelothrix sp. HDW6C TaxID=2714930 RepID=UPI00140E860C|nr:ankyrin repeat domain-containing protein [Erysipelothrix sp. HDW6C]QIK70673.1 ankyrin repeat domain-containing protein [Erysipelothrix sp. HDW6C]
MISKGGNNDKKILVTFFLLSSCAEASVPQAIENIDMQNATGATALLIAVHNNDIETAKSLIDCGANVNIQDLIHDSPYLYAGANGRIEIIKYMYEQATIDYSVRNRYGGNTLIPAAEKGHLETVRLILDLSEEPIDLQNNFGYTALIEAVALSDGSKVYQEIVRLLVDNGANQELRDNQGYTALDYALERNYLEIIDILSDN